MRVPIRARLAIVTAVLTAFVLAGMGAFVYFRFRADLRDAVDAGLRSRAETILAGLKNPGDPLAGRGLSEPDEAFAQVFGASYEVIYSSPGLRSGPVLSGLELGPVDPRFAPRFTDATVATVEEPVHARLVVVQAGRDRLVVVGASLDDQDEALGRLAALLAVGGPFALALVTWVGWAVTGAALRPVDRMREEAEAISASEPGRRLPVPGTGDEVARLGDTLNRMLERLEVALERERRFVGDASHELRTPLANLKAELELAIRGSRTVEGLEAALRSAAEETDRLSRLAEDLLVLARAEGGRIPVRREEVEVARVVRSVVDGFAARAVEAGVAVGVRAPDGVRASLDHIRFGQALGNLLDNGLRHAQRGGEVSVEVVLADGTVEIVVTNTGEGFPPAFLPEAFEPFTRPDAGRSRTDGGAGLGLALVRAVAEAHGGSAEARNRPEGGASVILRIPG